MADTKMPTTRETETGLEKWCARCKDYHPATLEYFYLDNSSKTKLTSWCRKKKNTGMDDGELADNFRLTLDFSNHQELYEKIQATADKEMRDTDKQILWWLREKLSEAV